MYTYVYKYTHRGETLQGFWQLRFAQAPVSFFIFLVCPQTHPEFNLKPKTDAN